MLTISSGLKFKIQLKFYTIRYVLHIFSVFAVCISFSSRLSASFVQNKVKLVIQTNLLCVWTKETTLQDVQVCILAFIISNDLSLYLDISTL